MNFSVLVGKAKERDGEGFESSITVTLSYLVQEVMVTYFYESPRSCLYCFEVFVRYVLNAQFQLHYFLYKTADEAEFIRGGFNRYILVCIFREIVRCYCLQIT